MSTRKVLIALLAFALASTGLAQTANKESDKASGVLRIMRSHTFHVLPKALPLCQTFLEDFAEQKGITYVEPILRADNYDDLKLDPYKSRCPDLEMNKLAACSPRTAFYIQGLPEDEREREADKLCSVYYGTKNFKLYELDLRRHSKVAKDIVLYFERIFGPQESDAKVYGDGGYVIFDSKNCRRRRGTHTHDPYDYTHNRTRENYNALIQYNSRYYIFDLFEMGGTQPRDPYQPTYRLHLEGNRKDGWGGLCSFSTNPTTASSKGESR